MFLPYQEHFYTRRLARANFRVQFEYFDRVLIDTLPPFLYNIIDIKIYGKC